jgi:hypothetical protein
MTMPTISQSKPAVPAQDSILALAPQPEATATDRDFEKVFEKTASEEAPKKDKPEKPDPPKKAEAKPVVVKPGTALGGTKGKVKKQQQRAEELTGLGHANAVVANQAPSAKAQSAAPKKSDAAVDPRAKASRPNKFKRAHSQKVDSQKPLPKKAGPNSPNSGTKKTAGKVSREPAAEAAAKPSSEQSARAALKRGQTLQAAKTKARKEARAELKTEEKAKSAELRERNAPVRALPKNLAQLAKTAGNAQKAPAREGDSANGTQVAVNSGEMVMQAKQSAPNEEARPAMVEELRPATSAELSSQAGNQQQDLSREQAKETPPPVMPIATTGTSAVQAFVPSAGIITPLMEKIWNAVSTYRARGGDEVVVKIQPDAKTELQLTIKYGKGGVEIQARMQQGDGQQLATGWRELQSALAERGVNLGELNRDGSAETDFDQTAQNFSKNSQNQAQNAELNIGDDQGDWSALGLKSKEQKEAQPTRREPVLPVHDGWQSWA